jgi:predicted small integral membrane protein
MMRTLSRLGGLPVVVAALTLISALQLALVTIGNITDYGTNYAFVRHVLAMDTTFMSPNVMWRAITSRAVDTAVYDVIIAWEALTTLVLIAAFVTWVRRGQHARRLSALGWLMWVMLFGGGFLAIGGEYFQMWQSSKWNGIQSALEYFIIGSVGLILANLRAVD